MINYSPQRLEIILNSIVAECFYSETFFNQLKSVGIDINTWIATPATAIFNEFYLLANLKGYEFARLSCVDKIRKLEIDDKIDFADPAFVTEYRAQIDFFRAKELAFKLMEKPLDADVLIYNYKKNTPSAVEVLSLTETIFSTAEMLETALKNNTARVIIPDFPKLSESIGGFNPSRLTLVSAISGFGKTKLAMNLALSASKTMKVLFFNMEMGQTDFMAQIIHQQTGITNTDWYRGQYDRSLLVDVAAKASERKTFLYTTGRSLNLEQIYSVVLKECASLDQTFVVVDYDQKITSSSREEEWFFLVRAMEKLEELAKITNSHILVLCQADDAGDIKASKRAKQPASTVINFFSEKVENDPFRNEVYLLKAIKNRFGKNGFHLEVDFDPARSQVTEKGFYEPEKKKNLIDKYLPPRY